MPERKLHPTARGFDTSAAEYERARPSYPDEAIADLVDELGIGPGASVLDLGAGTGKLTRLLVPSGARLVAAEPSEPMRFQLQSLLPDVEAVDATAENLPFEDATFDAVVAGQAFHWFDGDRALAEIHRVLRPPLRSGTQPGGGLGMLWNSRDDSVEWVQRLIELTRPYRGSGPKYRDGTWREAFGRTTLFTPLECRRYPYAHEVTADLMVDRMASISWIAVLPEEDRLQLLEQVRHLSDGMPAAFCAPYNTDLWWCRAIN